MTLVFQCTSPRYTYYIMHTECKLATRDATSHLAIPGTDFFSDVGASSVVCTVNESTDDVQVIFLSKRIAIISGHSKRQNPCLCVDATVALT